MSDTLWLEMWRVEFVLSVAVGVIALVAHFATTDAVMGHGHVCVHPRDCHIFSVQCLSVLERLIRP
jgi:hypothetical protein